LHANRGRGRTARSESPNGASEGDVFDDLDDCDDQPAEDDNPSDGDESSDGSDSRRGRGGGGGGGGPGPPDDEDGGLGELVMPDGVGTPDLSWKVVESETYNQKDKLTVKCPDIPADASGVRIFWNQLKMQLSAIDLSLRRIDWYSG